MAWCPALDSLLPVDPDLCLLTSSAVYLLKIVSEMVSPRSAKMVGVSFVLEEAGYWEEKDKYDV